MVIEENSLRELNISIKELMMEGWIPIATHVVTFSSYGVSHSYSICMYMEDDIEDELPDGTEL